MCWQGCSSEHFCMCLFWSRNCQKHLTYKVQSCNALILSGGRGYRPDRHRHQYSTFASFWTHAPATNPRSGTDQGQIYSMVVFSSFASCYVICRRCSVDAQRLPCDDAHGDGSSCRAASITEDNMWTCPHNISKFKYIVRRCIKKY